MSNRFLLEVIVQKNLEPHSRIEEQGYFWYLPGVGFESFDKLEDATAAAPPGAFLVEVALFQKVLGVKRKADE